MWNKTLLIICIFISSFANAQVDVVGYIQTNGVANYPTHIDSLGRGGYIVAKDTTERNAIPCLRKKYGMACYVQSVQKLYILKDSTCANTWVEFSGGGGGSLPTFNNGLSYESISNAVRWGGNPIYTNIQLDDGTYRGHSIQMGVANNEFYEINMKAGNITIEPTGSTDVQPSQNDFGQWKLMIVDTPSHKISSLNMNYIQSNANTYYKTTGYFLSTDQFGSLVPELVILENTMPNTHWGMAWNPTTTTWELSDDWSGAKTDSLNQWLNAHFGMESGMYHADAISVVMFPIDGGKGDFLKYGIQVLDKHGNPTAPTNNAIAHQYRIYFEIRRYFNYVPI